MRLLKRTGVVISWVIKLMFPIRESHVCMWLASRAGTLSVYQSSHPLSPFTVAGVQFSRSLTTTKKTG